MATLTETLLAAREWFSERDCNTLEKKPGQPIGRSLSHAALREEIDEHIAALGKIERERDAAVAELAEVQRRLDIRTQDDI